MYTFPYFLISAQGYPMNIEKREEDYVEMTKYFVLQHLFEQDDLYELQG